jgi:Flp pilus assembly secretin CpaC
MQMRRANAVVAALILFSGLFVVACGDDTGDYENRVAERLKQANIQNVDVDWNEDRRVLRLTGTVRTSDEATRAEAIAARTLGASGRVVNELEVNREPVGTTGPEEPAEPGRAAPVGPPPPPQ